MQQGGQIDAATSDEILAAAFAARATGAFAEAYLRHVDVLYTVARSVLGEPADAQDCVHDAILRVWLAPQSYRVERGTLRSFLVVCVRNAALTRRRSAARHRAIESRALPSADDDTQRFDDVDPVVRTRLREALSALPPEQLAVVKLAYGADRTQSQMAAEMRIPLGTVKSRISLALRKLATALGPSES